MDGTATIDVEILGVTEKQATRKSDGQPFTMYEIQVTDGTREGSATYSTTFVEQANDAYALLNKKARLAVKIQQNGKWINRYLQRVICEIDDDTLPDPSQMQRPTGFNGSQGNGGFNGSNNGVTSHTAPTQGFAGAPTSTATVVPSVVEQASVFEDARQAQIHRQTAAKVAAMLFVAGDSQVDFFDNCDSLVRYFDSGIKPLAVELDQESR